MTAFMVTALAFAVTSASALAWFWMCQYWRAKFVKCQKERSQSLLLLPRRQLPLSSKAFRRLRQGFLNPVSSLLDVDARCAARFVAVQFPVVAVQYELGIFGLTLCPSATLRVSLIHGKNRVLSETRDLLVYLALFQPG
jgi:hypothetical protein